MAGTDAVETAKSKWERRAKRRLNHIAIEQKRPLARMVTHLNSRVITIRTKRNRIKKKRLKKKDLDLPDSDSDEYEYSDSLHDNAAHPLRFVYEPDDLFMCIQRIDQIAPTLQ